MHLLAICTPRSCRCLFLSRWTFPQYTPFVSNSWPPTDGHYLPPEERLSQALSLARLLRHTLCVWYKAVCVIKVLIGNPPIQLICTQCKETHSYQYVGPTHTGSIVDPKIRISHPRKTNFHYIAALLLYLQEIKFSCHLFTANCPPYSVTDHGRA